MKAMKLGWLGWGMALVAMTFMLTLGFGQEAEEPAVSSDPPEPSTEAMVAEEDGSPGEMEQVEEDHGRGVGEVVQVGRDFSLKEDQEAEVVVVVFGSATVEGIVHENMVVVGGKALLNGTVHGNLVVVLGSAELGPKAHVEGDFVVVGGSMNADPASVVDGNRVDVSWKMITEKCPPLAGLWEWVDHALLKGRLLPPAWGWWWFVALALAVMALLTALVFHKPAADGVGLILERPVASFFTGLLVLVLLGPVLLLLAATGVGLVVVPFVLAAFAVACVLGKVVLCQFAGGQAGRIIRVSVLQRPVPALLVGLCLLYLGYMVPVLGCMIWVFTAPLGLGAVVLVTTRSFASETKPLDELPARSGAAPPADLGAVPPVIPGGAGSLSPVEMMAMPRAGFWIRFLSALIDLPLLGVFTAVTGLAPVFVLVWGAYYVTMWAWKGTTLGGVICGLRVVRRDGRPLDFAVAVIRCLGCFLSALALFVGFFWAGWTRGKLAWHDVIAGTVVVRVPSGTPLL